MATPFRYLQRARVCSSRKAGYGRHGTYLLITNYIWDEGDLGIPWEKKPNSITMHKSTSTVYERHSQCSAVLSDISPTLCEDIFLTLLKSNVQVAATNTRNNLNAATNQLVKNWGIVLDTAE